MFVTTHLRAAGATDTGRRRDHNEDRLHVDPDRGLFMVIDGVGGHAAGETAADLALRMLRARLERETGSVADRIREALTLANNEIHRTAIERPELKGMSAVATVAMVVDDRAFIGHVGDSRLYKLRAGEIHKITPDHGPVGEREDRGELSEADAMRHPRRNEIYRDLGSQPHTPTDDDFIDLIEIPFESDSALLLCTDGLTDLVPSAELCEVANAFADDPSEVTARLIDAANRAGGKDNISLVFVAGERFPGPRRASHRANSLGAGSRLRLDAIFNRWTMLVVGLIAGALAARFWPLVMQQFGSAPAVLDSVPAPRTFVVGGTPDADYRTISDAVAAASRLDTIEVEPGDYPEQIRVSDAVTLISRVAQQARLVPLPATERWVALTVEGAGGDGGGRVSGFAIAGGEGRALAIGVRTTNANIQLDALDISGASEAAIAIGGQSRVTVRAARIHDNPGAGVMVRDGATPELLHNYVTGNGRSTERAGVDIDRTSRPVLRWNVITDNGAANVVGLLPSDEATARRQNVIGAAPSPTRRPRAAGSGGRE